MEEENKSRARTNDELRAEIEKEQAGGNSWGDALQRQRRERDMQNGMETYGQMKELVGRQELAEIQNGQRTQDAIASALAIAQQNGGKLPRVVTDYLNRQFGFDGQTMGIMDGGIDEKGNFGFVFGERDRNGQTSYRKQMIPRTVQLGLMEGYPGLFGEDSVKAHRQKMIDEDKLASGEIDAYSKVARLARERREARIAELSPKPAGGWSPERVALENRRLDLRDNEEKGRNARAGSKNDTANARLVASIAKNWGDIRRVVNEGDREGFEKLMQTGLMAALGGGKEGGEERPAEAPAGGAAGARREKTVSGYRYNKDRTRRIPVYDDGSQGEIEDLKPNGK